MTELWPLFAYSIVMSGTPGPNNLLLTASGAHFGYRATLPHIMGIGLGNSVQILLTCLGLGAIMVRHPALHDALRWAGTAYLLYLAWKLTARPSLETRVAQPITLLEALLFQFVNPKSWMKSFTVATVFLPPYDSIVLAALVVTAVTWAVNIPCVSVWALFGMSLRRWLTDPLRQRIFNIIIGGTLVVLALTLLRL